MVNPRLEKLIYTLGTSTRAMNEFIELLISHNVEVVVDVRRFPTSRFKHFYREKLEGLLLEAGIDYVYMGEELGGYRWGGYQNFTATSQFQGGYQKTGRNSAPEESSYHMCGKIALALPPPFYCLGVGGTRLASKSYY
jgi:hypothetical protein